MSCNLIQIVQALRNIGQPGLQPTRAQIQHLAHFEGPTSTKGGSYVEPQDGRTYGMAGNAAGSTVKSKFGGISVRTANNGYVGLDRSTSSQLGTQDFTIEFWVNQDASVAGIQGLMNIGAQGAGLVAISMTADRKPQVVLGNVGPVVAAGALPPEVWHHLALTRKGALFTLWVNGNPALTTTNASFNQNTNYDYFAWSYVNPNGGNAYFTGYFDELRIVRGLAVYDAPFSPPTEPFTMPSA